MINHQIGTFFVCDFQLSNKKSLDYTYLTYHSLSKEIEFELHLFDWTILVCDLTLTIVLFLLNLYINITAFRFL
jgi:hypothetical protein